MVLIAILTSGCAAYIPAGYPVTYPDYNYYPYSRYQYPIYYPYYPYYGGWHYRGYYHHH